MTRPDLTRLPAGQRRAAEALVRNDKAPTYKEVAGQLELSVGTVYEHLRRIRTGHPEIYAALIAYRKGQLEHRHEEALERDQAHSRRYFRRRANYRYYQRFGRWPWERL